MTARNRPKRASTKAKAASIGRFFTDHPTIKTLALSFLMVVGMALVAEGLGHKVPKGYIYFAMAFSVAVEMLNIRMRKKRTPPRTLARSLPRRGAEHQSLMESLSFMTPFLNAPLITSSRMCEFQSSM